MASAQSLPPSDRPGSSGAPTQVCSDFMSQLATAASPVGIVMTFTWTGTLSSLFLRTIIIGLSATAAFSLFEVWPRTLPRWLQRWALQVIAVGVVMPVTTFLVYVLSTPQG